MSKQLIVELVLGHLAPKDKGGRICWCTYNYKGNIPKYFYMSQNQKIQIGIYCELRFFWACMFEKPKCLCKNNIVYMYIHLYIVLLIFFWIFWWLYGGFGNSIDIIKLYFFHHLHIIFLHDEKRKTKWMIFSDIFWPPLCKCFDFGMVQKNWMKKERNKILKHLAKHGLVWVFPPSIG